jgi:flagellar motor protein MotB
MHSKAVRLIVFILFLIIFTSYRLALIDSDNDLVPDEQEIKDGTDPEDASDNALFLNVSGNIAVGNTITLSVEHKTLGKIPDIDFIIKTKAKTINLNSGASGEVSFKIEEAGIHYITAHKNNFLLTTDIIPKCGYREKPVAILPFVLLLTSHFTNIVVALIFFLLFSIILRAYLTSSSKLANSFAGAIAFAVFFANYNFLFPAEKLILHLSLLLELIAGLFTLWVLKVKQIPKKLALKHELAKKRSLKLFKTLAIMFRIVLLQLQAFLISKKLAVQSKLKLKRALSMRKNIHKTKEKLNEAVLSTAKAKSHEEAQKALHAIREQIEKLHESLHKALILKAEVAQKEEKSIEELRAERELELMIEDISEQLAQELNISELPEEIEPPHEKGNILAALFAKIKPKPKEAKQEPNVCLSISDEYGKALNASKAEFFIGGKQIQPIKVLAERACFYFTQTVVELYVRYLGFVDSYNLIEPGSTLQEIKIKMKPTLVVNVVDENGNPLRDAFITIVDEKDNKISDVYKNNIWKTPFPSNAEAGTASIPINPADLKSNILKIRVVRAGFANREVVIPASRISTEEQLVKIITLEKIAATK